MTMYVRFYFDMTVQDNEVVEAVKQRFRRLEEKDSFYSSRGQTLYGFQFQQNEEGTYVQYDHFLLGVPTALTAEANLIVRRVEMYEDFPLPSSYDRKEGAEPKFQMPRGVYEHTGTDAQAIVDDYQRSDSSHGHMRLRVVATNIEAAVTLFNLIRKGEIEPVEPWIDAPKTESDEGKVLALATTGK
jgi:hypothetical protein